MTSRPSRGENLLITLDADVPMGVRDGTAPRSDVYRPVARGPWPALPCRTPYDKLREHYAGIARSSSRLTLPAIPR